MVTVRIGGETRSLADATESWINDQINRRRHDGQNICAEVIVNVGSLNLRLSTPGCSGGVDGGRLPNPTEREVFELWNKRGLDSSNFSGENLVSFLKQLRRWLL